MSISEGLKANNIQIDKVEKVSQSNQGNLIFKYKDDEKWYFVFVPFPL